MLKSQLQVLIMQFKKILEILNAIIVRDKTLIINITLSKKPVIFLAISN